MYVASQEHVAAGRQVLLVPECVPCVIFSKRGRPAVGHAAPADLVLAVEDDAFAVDP